MRKKIRTLTITLLAVIGLAIPVTAASAAPSPQVKPTCSHFHCDGKWPIATHCSLSERTAKSVDIKHDGMLLGKIQLRYSSDCHTVWARVIAYKDHGKGAWAQVLRNSKRRPEIEFCKKVTYSKELKGYSCYSKMLYDGGTQSWAIGRVPGPDGKTYPGQTGLF